MNRTIKDAWAEFFQHINETPFEELDRAFEASKGQLSDLWTMARIPSWISHDPIVPKIVVSMDWSNALLDEVEVMPATAPEHRKWRVESVFSVYHESFATETEWLEDDYVEIYITHANYDYGLVA